MNVNENEIRVMRIEKEDYISLTDIARHKNKENPGDVIKKWMSNKSSFDFYCLWEELFNNNFKLAESLEFKIDSAMSSSQWCTRVNAVGMTYQTRRIVLDK